MSKAVKQAACLPTRNSCRQTASCRTPAASPGRKQAADPAQEGQSVTTRSAKRVHAHLIESTGTYGMTPADVARLPLTEGVRSISDSKMCRVLGCKTPQISGQKYLGLLSLKNSGASLPPLPDALSASSILSCDHEKMHAQADPQHSKSISEPVSDSSILFACSACPKNSFKNQPQYALGAASDPAWAANEIEGAEKLCVQPAMSKRRVF